MIDRELRRLRDRAAKFIDEVSDAGIKWPGTLARFALKEIDRDRQPDDETGEPFIDPDAGVIDEQMGRRLSSVRRPFRFLCSLGYDLRRRWSRFHGVSR
jgi:hypothetical protein